MLADGSPSLLVSFLVPELLEPLRALATDPAAGEMHCEVAVAVAHVVAALHVCIELALWVDADVVAHELVLEHEVLDRVLLGSNMVLAHEHSIVGHHLEDPSSEGGTAEKGAAGIDALVILCDQDVDVLDAEVFGCEDVGGVLLELTVEDWGVAHQALLDRGGREHIVCKGDFRVHYNDVGVDQPDPFGVGVKGECFGHSGNLGPCLRNSSQ
jgi:hypothetical protein